MEKGREVEEYKASLLNVQVGVAHPMRMDFPQVRWVYKETLVRTFDIQFYIQTLKLISK
jgi:hypothetical protein